MAEDIAANRINFIQNRQTARDHQAQFRTHASGHHATKWSPKLHHVASAGALERHHFFPCVVVGLIGYVAVGQSKLFEFVLRKINAPAAVLLPVYRHILPMIDELQSGTD